MKNKINIVIITVYCIASSSISAGYGSTTKEERIARSAHEDEAYLTSHQEEIARTERLDEAILTENQEERERREHDNDARSTTALERAARS